MKIDRTKTLNDYSAGSAIAYMDGRLYLAGDDMGYILVLDTDLNVIDSITLTDEVTYSMPKTIKADLEAATVVQQDGENVLLFVSSGSLDPYRNKAWLVNVRNKQKTEIDLQPFYSRLKAQGLHDLNIEGAATVKDMILLSARGNKTKQVNHIVFTSAEFWKEQATAPISIKTVRNDERADGSFCGVSGLEYASQSDCLILTISTEDTGNAYDDGAIGKSYLWLIYDLHHKLNSEIITPDFIIDLEAADSRFMGQKIESACIILEKQHKIQLAFAADNDNGKTELFIVTINRK